MGLSWDYQFELVVESFPTPYTIHLKFLKQHSYFKNLNNPTAEWRDER